MVQSNPGLLRLPALVPLTLTLVVVGCRHGPAPVARNVVLISIDTLRPDHLGSYGYDRPTSPTLDALAAAGVLFEDASSPSPWTLPAHASLLTGRYPSHHGLVSHRTRLPVEVPTLAELLQEHGYRTAAVVNSQHLSERYGLHRGFASFEYLREDVSRVEPSGVEREASRWLSDRGGEPFFLFLHLYDVHSDYASLPQYEEQLVRPSPSNADGTTRQLLLHRQGAVALDEASARHLSDLYDAGIRQADDSIRRLLDALRREDLLEDTVVIVTSDHGEELFEHGGVLHGRTQFEEVIRVPLIVAGPEIPQGVRVDRMVSLVDIAPTVLSLAAVAPPPDLDGIELGLLWHPRLPSPPARLLFAEADHNNARPNVKRAVRHRRYKLHHDLLTGAWALFDLVADPGEQHDIAAREAAVAALLRERLEAFMAGERAGAPVGPLSAEDEERLSSLGYLR